MILKLSKRLFIGGICAIILAFTTAIITQASPAQQTGGAPDECQECHEEVVSHWQESAHGTSATNMEFQEAWSEANEDPNCLACHTTDFDAATGTYAANAVTCDACHQLAPNAPHHPEQIMLTDVSADLCGSCHLDTFSEFQTSVHGAEDVTCIRCHSQHDTELKAESVQEVCISCHQEESHFYTYTAHAEADLLCTDCHLRVNDAPLGEGHGLREHTFGVDMTTCNDCHESAMHAPSAAMTNNIDGGGPGGPSGGETAVSDTTAISHPTLNLDTSFNSSTNFILLAALIGLAFGAVGSPWIEKRLVKATASNK